MIYLIILGIYILGCILFCLFNHSRIGTISEASEWWGIEEYTIEASDIIMESIFWPIMLLIFIVISPMILGTFLLEKYHNYRTKSK